jgi:hypothetical protein
VLHHAELCSLAQREARHGSCPSRAGEARFYAIPPLDVAEFKKIEMPLICHFANKDDWCTPAKVNELEAALKESKSSFELHRYDAQHAFMNEARPQVYDAVSAKTAWDRTRVPEKGTRVSERLKARLVCVSLLMTICSETGSLRAYPAIFTSRKAVRRINSFNDNYYII